MTFKIISIKHTDLLKVGSADRKGSTLPLLETTVLLFPLLSSRSCLGSGSLCDAATGRHAVVLEMEDMQETNLHPQRKM